MENLKVKVSNLEGRSGRAVPNQFEIKTANGNYFQSYESVIAFKPFNKEEAFFALNPGKCLKDLKLNDWPEAYLDQMYWNYSRTTSKYRNDFLGETTKETLQKINRGEYQLTNLN